MRKRNLKEFETLAYPHMDNLHNYALQMTRNPDDAGDLVQEAYLRAWMFFDRFNRGTNFRAWITRILTNLFINKYNRRKNGPQFLEIETASFMRLDDGSAFESRAELFDIEDADMFLNDEIYTAFFQLSEKYRTVIFMADINEFSYQEISDILNLPIGTVMSRLSRGRKQLARKIRHHAKPVFHSD